MSADLRDLLDATAPRPNEAVDPAAIRVRSRRRRRTRRLGGGGFGLAVLALVVAVAWPGALPGDLVIDDVADTPDAEEIPTLDLPDGWQQVRVGDAVLGVPADRLPIEQLGRPDYEPCRNAGPRAFIVSGEFPLGAVACRAFATSDPMVLTAQLSQVPADRFDRSHDEPFGRWEPYTDGPVAGEVRVVYAGDEDEAADGLAGRTVAYRFPSVDLYLDATTNRADVALIESILTTITPISASAEALPSGEIASQPDPSSSDATPRSADDPLEVDRSGVPIGPSSGPRTSWGEWVLVEGTGREGAVPTNAAEPVTLEMTDHLPPSAADLEPPTPSTQPRTWAGSDGCGDYEAPAWLAGSDVAVVGGSLLRTYGLCGEAAEGVRTTYLAALENVDRLDVDDGQLVLLGPGTRLVFEPGDETATTVGRLLGTTWLWRALAAPAGHGPAPGGTQLMIEFGPDGRMTADGPCNVIDARFELVEGDRIRFGPTSRDLMNCGDGTFAEDHLAVVLSDGTDRTFSVTETGLGITEPEGRSLVRRVDDRTVTRRTTEPCP